METDEQALGQYDREDTFLTEEKRRNLDANQRRQNKSSTTLKELKQNLHSSAEIFRERF